MGWGGCIESHSRWTNRCVLSEDCRAHIRPVYHEVYISFEASLAFLDEIGGLPALKMGDGLHGPPRRVPATMCPPSPWAASAHSITAESCG
mmetsp:Transcript_18515/g.55859  ORF Transcript_18515/g.55859 Transcript_18515/m.55859 type:complete len:91 (+) Transcript_18515:624-896(+)|eukprot:scaffold57302_cov36-Tisochrysis_lutea.AAC.6